MKLSKKVLGAQFVLFLKESVTFEADRTERRAGANYQARRHLVPVASYNFCCEERKFGFCLELRQEVQSELF